MAAPTLERLSTGVRWADLRLPGSSRAVLAGLAPPPRGVTLALFSGPASTGKTLAARRWRRGSICPPGASTCRRS
jgi:hypothetical protein